MSLFLSYLLSLSHAKVAVILGFSLGFWELLYLVSRVNLFLGLEL
jgi:hypothetical protein